MENNARECEFDLGNITLRGKRWGQEGGRPVFALHGWLDNCASFDFLAPLLNNVDLVALDLAGQGQSGHRQSHAAYNIWHDITEVLYVAKQLGWTTFGLLGHSRGAMISTLLAGAFPAKVTHLGLIESFIPHVIEAEKAAEQMAGAIESVMAMNERYKSSYDSFEQAVKARQQGFLPLCYEDALALAKRGVQQQQNGRVYWHYDARLNAPSEVKLTFEQAKSFVDRITCPIEIALASGGLVGDFERVMELIETTPNVTAHTLEGGHHLHMSQQCQALADLFNPYFASE